jgi:hypothetical protein
MSEWFENIQPYKICPICKQNKQSKDYYVYFSKKRNTHRISNYCKDCGRIKSNERAKNHYELHKEQKKEYAKKYRRDPEKKEQLRLYSRLHNCKYRNALSDAYIRHVLHTKWQIPQEYSKSNPEIVETHRLQIQIYRKIKSIKNGKK